MKVRQVDAAPARDNPVAAAGRAAASPTGSAAQDPPRVLAERRRIDAAFGPTRVVQRAPVIKVVSADTVGKYLLHGGDDFRPYVVRRKGLPDGFHATIFIEGLTAEQQNIFTTEGLGKVPGFESVQFTEFNITKDEGRQHFNFDEHGRIQWRQTKTEASVESPDWGNAIRAAAFIYSLIGVGATESSLIAQLHTDHGRKSPVGDNDAWWKAEQQQATERDRQVNEKIAAKGPFGGLKPRVLSLPKPAPKKLSAPRVEPRTEPHVEPSTEPVVPDVSVTPDVPAPDDSVKARILTYIALNAARLAESLPQSLAQEHRDELVLYIWDYVAATRNQFDTLYAGWDLEARGEEIIQTNYVALVARLKGA